MMIKHFISWTVSCLLLIFSLQQAKASVNITEVGGWFESGYVTWTPTETASSYHVYYKSVESASYNILDDALVRDYGSYGRADMVGLKAGQYMFKVVPVDASGNEIVEEATESTTFTAVAHRRDGYAHFNYNEGIGAYRNDGTLKAGAKIIYVHAGNAKTVQCNVVTSSKGTSETRTGLQNIIAGYEKGFDSTPLAIRIIGTIRDTDMDSFGSSSEGIQIKGKKNTTPLNITLEGIGCDATVWGFGFLIRNALSVELRNFGIMLCMDDCVSIDTDNSHIWVHNMDLFYGNAGGDSDQAKGDGVIDLKGDSQYITVGYNHFWDSGKSSLCGMKSETSPNWITYHHNWFDHSDSRHPRIRTMSVHIYNNYFDGNSKYGVGVTSGGNAFVENNYFRSCSRPMMISLQGTDTKMGTDYKEAPTFSGESGGMIKSFGNIYAGKYTYAPYSATNTIEFDAYESSVRDEQVPASIKSKDGGYSYSNFDTSSSTIYPYTPDAADDVPAIVSGILGAGRMQHGDFQWTFNNETEDNNYGVISNLKKALQQYKTSLVGFFGKSISGESSGSDDKEDNSGSGDSSGDDNNNSGDNNSGNNNNNTPSIPSTSADSIVCVFVGKKPSNSFFTISGNYSDSKGSATVDNVTYTECLKIESSTSISFSTTRSAKIKIVFGSTETPSLKVNGNTISNTANTSVSGNVLYIDPLSAGTYTLTKDKSVNVYYIGLFYTQDETGISSTKFDVVDPKSQYDLQGRLVSPIHKGIIINNGKKRLYR